MQKLPIGKYLGAMIVLWGITTTTTSATKGFATLCVNRVFLGFFECCMSPILVILIGRFWTRDEHPLRSSIWWTGSAVGGFIADAITYGISRNTFNNGRYATWQVCIWLWDWFSPGRFHWLNVRQIIYLVFGPISIAWGIMIMLSVPSSPKTAWFLSKREREVADARVSFRRLHVDYDFFLFLILIQRFDPSTSAPMITENTNGTRSENVSLIRNHGSLP